MSKEYRKLAKNIVNEKIYNNTCKNELLEFSDVLDFVNYEYKKLFKVSDQDVNDDNIIYKFNDNLNDFQANESPVSITNAGIKTVSITLGKDINYSTIISLAHEKAHAIQQLNSNETTELIPTLMGYYFVTQLEDICPNLNNKFIDYELSYRKKLANKYLNFSLIYNDNKLSTLINQLISYKASVNNSLNLDNEHVKYLICENLFNGLKVNVADQKLINIDNENFNDSIKKLRGL